MKNLDPIDVQQLSEGQDLEVKKAAGKDGCGKLRQSFFETYAAMGNTTGGVILVGSEEKPRGHFRARGIEDVDDVLTGSVIRMASASTYWTPPRPVLRRTFSPARAHCDGRELFSR